MSVTSTSEKISYLDTSLPFAERTKDLIGRMTLEEKVGLMNHPSHGIPRLNIPAYNYWSEALHGVARNGRATVFPQAIAMAATWDKELIYQVASAIGDEGRAKYHAALKRNGYTAQYQGLTFWSPNVNIFRDPRWGRGQETWGEDPFLTGEMASEYVKGLQGNHPKYLKAAACAKHYAVHSGPEKDRHWFNAIVTKRELYDTYLPAFKKLVMEAKVESVMGAYNRTLDEVCCASELLLDNILRGEWGFGGHVVSDCMALSDFHLHHKVTEDAADSAALALKYGCDLGCDHVFSEIPTAIKRGDTTEELVNRALERTLGTRFKLGMFDPDEKVPFASISMDVVACDEHRQLAYRAATESVVLLKNKNNILPIKPSTKKIFVTGPTAASMEVLLGNYYGINNQMITLLEGLTGRIPEGMGMEYTSGAMLKHPREVKNTWAASMAQTADFAIVCAGLSSFLEGEEGESLLSPENGDRESISLPQSQIDYIKELAIHGVKIVLVLTGGSPIALGEIEDMVDAILFVWYPGMEGGRAVADVLFGDVSPSGKLPITFPKSLDQLPAFDDYSMNGRTYRYMAEEPLYPFGFGLSYSKFEYSDLQLETQTPTLGDFLHLSLTLTNSGASDSAEVAQLYLSDLQASTIVPFHHLIGFERVFLKAGETRVLKFTVTPEMMSFYNDDGKLTLEPGQFRLEIGGCSPSKRGQELNAPKPLFAVFEVK
ncbi:glycoside hydrolase family 3 C-terminal domain-containing protein [Candidatus Villigracilis affinis]|uniref:glycoside hydrolase family 3 C-terminal domain-containing protein n=1 Tax=Candidatus Villigracilis affinis TaxID=3140682 RepID=UPI001DB8150D|nr:glycoside hydrolase family 3 C-terminal domain-containing protein [Anaerolineales bacterium]